MSFVRADSRLLVDQRLGVLQIARIEAFVGSSHQFVTRRLLSQGSERPFRNWLSGVQLIKQRLRLFQVERVEAFGEPAVDRREKIASFLPFALIAPEPRHAHRGP
jgi:hypothetical protein